MASTRETAFREMPGAAPDVMRDYDLATLGYEETEFSFEGTAASYELQGERGADGQWDATPGAEAPFRTRIVVRKPKDALRFSGTVVVEWHNVSAGIDAAPDWGFFHRSLAAAGHAWVGVSAQKVGIDGGGFVESIHLKLLAPERYKDLEHPGDAWSFDIFTQVGRLLQLPERREPARRPGALADPGGRRVAVGRLPGDLHQRRRSSCAALRRVLRARPTGVGRVHRRGVHPGVRARLGMEATRVAISSTGERIRDDARVPVLVLQSETDVILLGGGLAEQPDSDRLRVWEMAGAAHADTYTVSAGRHDDGTLTAERMAELLRPTTNLMIGQTDYADQRRATAALRGPGGAGAPGPLGGRGRGAAVGALARARRRPNRLRPRRARHRQGWDPHAVGRRADCRHGRSRADAARPSPCCSAVPSPSTTPPCRRSIPVARTSTSNGSPLRLDAAIAAGFLLEEDRIEILAVAAHSYPLRLADG